MTRERSMILMLAGLSVILGILLFFSVSGLRAWAVRIGTTDYPA
jgi:hypothetical protein